MSIDYSQGVHDLVCKEQKSLYGLNQSPRAWFGKFCKVIQQFDDIVITDNDQEGIKDLKQHLFSHFQTKDIGWLRYLLGIVAQPQEGIAIFQGKYVLGIFEETGCLSVN